MRRLLLRSISLAVLLHANCAEAVSFGVDGQPVVYERDGQICFRVEKYVYSHSVVSFLNWRRSIDARDVRLLDASVGAGPMRWSIAFRDETMHGMRLRRSTGICYGGAPPGFVTTDEAEPLVAGRYTILMNAREGDHDLRFYDHFCLADDGRVVPCDSGDTLRPSFLERFFRWIWGR